MNDESTTQTPPSFTPPGDPTPRPRLRRSRSDRVALGVSGGIARHFDIDPVIPRLVFVALTVAGGSGLLLYLIAWLVIPDETEDETAAMNALRGGQRRGGWLVVVAAIALLMVLALSGSFIWLPGVPDGVLLPLLILGAGLALLMWPSESPTWRREGSEEHGRWRHGYNRVAPASGQDLTQDLTTAYPTDPMDPAVPPPPSTPAVDSAPPQDRPPRPPRPRSFLGPLGFAAVLVFIGVNGLAEAADWWSTSAAQYLAGSLVILGLVLVVSAFVGRARGLIWVGALLLPVAWAVTAIDVDWYDGIGEQTETPASLAELDATYHWGIGQLIVDLSDIDLDGEVRQLEVGLTIGEVQVYVPDTFATDVHVEAQLGSVVLHESGLRTTNDGSDPMIDRTVGDPEGGTLELDLAVGLGEAELIVCGETRPRCP